MDPGPDAKNTTNIMTPKILMYDNQAADSCKEIKVKFSICKIQHLHKNDHAYLEVETEEEQNDIRTHSRKSEKHQSFPSSSFHHNERNDGHDNVAGSHSF